MKHIFGSLKYAPILVVLGMLTAYGGDTIYILGPPANSNVLVIDFNADSTGWISRFADYPSGRETFYELSSSYTSLPASLGQHRKGIKISGNNHSDDLFMFITKKLTGFTPNTRYELDFEVTIGTDVHSNCFDIGGSLGNSIWVKAGASKTEPKPVNDGTGFYLLNLDKGNQAVGGNDVMLMGDIANGLPCDNSDKSYKKKTLTSERARFTTYSNTEGEIWVLFGTDSGYKGPTSIYFVDALIKTTKR